MNLKETMHLSYTMIKYNMKIIFANKYLYFLLAAFIVYVGFITINLFNGQTMNESEIYNLLIFTGTLLIFYPFAFGIQGDKDARTLEIIFGIPNYRYRIWLMRLFMIIVQTYFIILPLACLASSLLYDIDVISMSLHVMFPIVFIGLIAFYLSTLVRSGSGSAVITIIISVVFLVLAGNNTFYESFWNIFFNPYGADYDMNEVVWASLTMKNRFFLSVASLILLLSGLTKLQNREKFLK